MRGVLLAAEIQLTAVLREVGVIQCHNWITIFLCQLSGSVLGACTSCTTADCTPRAVHCVPLVFVLLHLRCRRCARSLHTSHWLSFFADFHGVGWGRRGASSLACPLLGSLRS